MDSIYTQCSNAARRLMSGSEVFTESDVVLEAATEAWTEANYTEADRHAPQVLAALFRNLKLVRFGIVDPTMAPLTGEADYVRREGQMLYGNRQEWRDKKLNTPNGEFNPIHFGDDPIFKSGRRKVSTRNDFAPWQEQVPTRAEPRPDVTSLRRNLAKMQAALDQEQAKNERLAQENERLRASLVSDGARARA